MFSRKRFCEVPIYFYILHIYVKYTGKVLNRNNYNCSSMRWRKTNVSEASVKVFYTRMFNLVSAVTTASTLASVHNDIHSSSQQQKTTRTHTDTHTKSLCLVLLVCSDP